MPIDSFLHEVEYGRASLAVDLMEEFRWLVDGLVLSLINRRELVQEDFQKTEENGIRLTDRARKLFYAKYEDRISDEAVHRNKQEKYRRIFHLQAEHLGRVCLGEEAVYLPHLAH